VPDKKKIKAHVPLARSTGLNQMEGGDPSIVLSAPADALHAVIKQRTAPASILI